MAPKSEEAKILRAEALKFTAEVQQNRTTEPRSPETQTHAVTVGQESISEQATKKEFQKFLRRVRGRFSGDAHDTYVKFLDTVIASAGDQFRISKVYTKVCYLFVGHADLFYDFERFLNDGSEETHREIKDLRVRVRQDFVGEIDAALRNYRSATERMEEIQRRSENPGNITGLHSEYIERAWFSEDDADPAMKLQMMVDFLTNPRSFCHLVLPCLKKKQKVLRQMYAFVLDYFRQVSSYPISCL